MKLTGGVFSGFDVLVSEIAPWALRRRQLIFLRSAVEGAFMLLVVTDEDDIPAWLYPEAFPEVPRPPKNWIKAPTLGESDFAALWRAVDPTAVDVEALE